jgi:hypothetical protein
MNASEADERVVLSGRVIARWERDSQGPVPWDMVRMVRCEIGTLEGLAFDHPGQAVKIARLIGRYDALVGKLSAHLN